MNKATRKLITFLIGTVFFLGLPLIGWGLDDPLGFLKDTGRAGYCAFMFFSSILVVLFVPEEGRGRAAGKKIVARQKLTILFLQVIPLTMLIVAPYCDRRQWGVMGHQEIRYVGLALTLVGFTFMNWAILALGKQFSLDVTVQENHRLITKGPYLYIRHPRYLGIILFLFGIAMVFRSWIALVLAALSVAVLIWRIHDEEKLMHEEFSTEWRQYAQKSWRLLPFVY